MCLSAQHQKKPPELFNASGIAQSSSLINLSQIVSAIVQIKSLKAVNLFNARLTAEQIKMITACPNIRRLNLSAGAYTPVAQGQWRKAEAKVGFSSN
jgi:hypothetical protein